MPFFHFGTVIVSLSVTVLGAEMYRHTDISKYIYDRIKFVRNRVNVNV